MRTIEACISEILATSERPMRDAAVFLRGLGLQVIPTKKAEKKSRFKWEPWLTGLNQDKIRRHWMAHPDDDIGAVVSDELIVFDADSEQAIAALRRLEAQYGVTPNLVVRTTRGEHHYFRRRNGTCAKPEGHGDDHPERIDVKTGRSLIMLPPSTGKSIVVGDVSSLEELPAVGQDFIEAVVEHNGGRRFQAPQMAEAHGADDHQLAMTQDMQALLLVLLDHLDPDMGYDDWSRVLIVLFNVTGGSADGLELADAWSSLGRKYRGTQEIRAKWQSFHRGPLGIGTLIHMVRMSGQPWPCSCHDLGDRFEVCETTVIADS